MRANGAQVEEFDLGMLEYAIPAYYVTASAEASSNLERFDGVKDGYRAEDYEGLHDMYKCSRSEGFGPEVKRRIMLGSFVLSSGYYDADHLKALRTKALIKKAFDSAFARYDLILAPAAPPRRRSWVNPSAIRSDVSGRYLYRFCEPGRTSGHHCSLWGRQHRFACGDATDDRRLLQ